MLKNFPININENLLSDNKEIYYIFDCPGLDAFAHWFYECFIFYENIFVYGINF